MRSELVFEAVHTLRNRYTLCQLASKATRKFLRRGEHAYHDPRRQPRARGSGTGW